MAIHCLELMYGIVPDNMILVGKTVAELSWYLNSEEYSHMLS